MSEQIPYVGVSGVVNGEQQRQLREVWDSLEHGNRVLAFGVKAVRTTQWLDMENKYGPSWYPVGDDIVHAVEGGRTDELRVAQVYLNHIEAVRAGEVDYTNRFVDKIMGRTAGVLTAIQFDLLPWDSLAQTDVFARIKQSYPDTEIILEAYRQQMAQHGPKELVRRLNWYDGLVDRVLFDASHGTGKRLDTEALQPFVYEATHRTSMGVGIAGGLNAVVVAEELPCLLRDYPDLSFDAEGRLHAHEDPAERSLNMPAVRQYLRAAADVSLR